MTTALYPYIHFNGNAEAAFMFYQSVFGGTFSSLVRFKELQFEGAPNLESEAEKIMHIALPIGPYGQLLGSDTPEMMGRHHEAETRSKLFLSVASREEANRIFEGLSYKGQIEMPLMDSPWGSYFGMFRDQFGIEWMIEYKS
ncbi:MAG: hypothetical protein RLZZ500_211 [Bacteroidota bacterium]|jgi:PhnB protein